jgi:hypothetical protein
MVLLLLPDMPIHLTSAHVKGGVSGTTTESVPETVFPLSLPYSGANRDASSKYRVECLSLNARVLTTRSTYALELNLTLKEDKWQKHMARLDNPFATGQTVATLARKFADLHARTKRKYPFLTRVPRVELVQPDPSKPDSALHFMVTLPAYTSLTTDDPFLWETMGIAEELVESDPDATRHGFFNPGGDVMVYVGDPVQTGLNLALSYEGARGEDAPAVNQPLMEVTFSHPSDAFLPLSAKESKPLDVVGATTALGQLLETGLAMLNLRTSYLEVQSTSSGELQFRSKNFSAGAEAVVGGDPPEVAACLVTVRFSPEITRFLSLTDSQLTFPSDDKREYTVKLPPDNASRPDPLLHRYPLALMCTNLGSGEHYIEGFGKVSLLGYALSSDHFRGDGIVVQGQANELRLFLVDLHHEVVRSFEDTAYFLGLNTTNLF